MQLVSLELRGVLAHGAEELDELGLARTVARERRHLGEAVALACLDLRRLVGEGGLAA